MENNKDRHGKGQTRDRTVLFIQKRNEKRHTRRPRTDTTQEKSNNGMVPLDEDVETGTLKKHLAPPPHWMKIIDEVNSNIISIKEEMKALQEAHKRHLVPQFDIDNRNEEEENIEKITSLITSLFQNAKNNIQKIGVGRGVDLTPREEAVKENIQSSLALQIQNLTKVFKDHQDSYLHKMNAKQPKGQSFFIQETVDSNFTVSLTPEQQQAVDEMDESVSQRAKEVKQIAASINELASIFRDLAFLVVEQGTMLDRIDYNIEQTKVNTKKGVVNLVHTEQSQKGYRNKLCMLLLCLGILFLLIFVIIKIFL